MSAEDPETGQNRPGRPWQPAFAADGVPVWAKIGGAVVGVLVLVVLGLVIFSPSAPSQKGAVASLPPLPPVVTTTTLAPGALDTQGGLGVTTGTLPRAATPPAPSSGAGCDPDAGGCGSKAGSSPARATCGSCGGSTTLPPTTTIPHGLRTATPAELTAIAAGMQPPAGQKFDSVAVAESNGAWALLHVAAAGAKGPEWVLANNAGGHWKGVTSGYPQIACFPPAAGVQQDLTGYMTPCP